MLASATASTYQKLPPTFPDPKPMQFMPFAGAVIENTIQSSFNYYDDLPNVAVA
jgi:hypothetical protein